MAFCRNLMLAPTSNVACWEHAATCLELRCQMARIGWLLEQMYNHFQAYVFISVSLHRVWNCKMLVSWQNAAYRHLDNVGPVYVSKLYTYAAHGGKCFRKHWKWSQSVCIHLYVLMKCCEMGQAR